MGERAPSIRGRLSNALILVSVVWGVAVAVVVSYAVQHEVDEILDEALVEASQILQPLLRNPGLWAAKLDSGALPAPPHKEEMIWQVVDVRQGVLLRSHDAPVQPMASADQRAMATAPNGWRVLVSELDSPQRLLMVAQIGSERREAKLEAVQYTVGGALLVGLLCAAWLRSRVRRELEPLSDLTAAVAQFDPLKPEATLADVHREELRPVRDAVANLGARLAARVTHERAFAAHAAHALRTPLAGMMAQLAAAQRVCPEEAQPMVALARQAAERLRRVVGAILTLFRSGTEVKWKRLKLSVLLPMLQTDALQLTIEPPDELVADPDLLAAALANLLDNAVRHGARQVGMSLQTDSHGAVLRLLDDGPGIPEEERLDLQKALDAQLYQRPLGMGLMLADLVARAHGGSLRLLPSVNGCHVEMRIGRSPGLPGTPAPAPEPPLASRW